MGVKRRESSSTSASGRRFLSRRRTVTFLVAATALGAGCTPPPPAAMLGGWSLTSVNGEPVTRSTLPSLQLNADGTFSIRGGCGSTNGTFSIDQGVLTFEDALSDLVGCEVVGSRADKEKFARQKAILNEMADGVGPRRIDLDRDVLTLTLPDGVFVTYSRSK